MRWYSVDKFLPAAGNDVFIRAVRIDGSYERHFVGMIDDFNGIENLNAWELCNFDNLIDIDVDKYIVTHFAIIEPIEIET